MKTTTAKSISVYAGLVVLAFCVGAYWGTYASVSLNGLRSAGPLTHAEEVAFIRSRIDWPVFPPEWVSGIELNELTWIKYEILARCGISISVSVAAIFLWRLILRRKNENGA